MFLFVYLRTSTPSLFYFYFFILFVCRSDVHKSQLLVLVFSFLTKYVNLSNFCDYIWISCRTLSVFVLFYLFIYFLSFPDKCNREVRHIVIVKSEGKFGFSEPTSFSSVSVRDSISFGFDVDHVISDSHFCCFQCNF